MGRYRSIQSTLIEVALKGITDREEIAEMLSKIRSEKILRYIWIFVSDICKDLGIKTDK